MLFPRLIKRKECLVPTGLGWTILIGIFAGVVITGVFCVYPFLAVSDPVAADVLVVEGWLPDYALEQAKTEFERRGYSLLLTTGEPLPLGSYLLPYKSYAELSASTLKHLGVPKHSVVAVPSLLVRRDRTLASAVALAEWLKNSRPAVRSLNILTFGVHARNSRSIFQYALGDSMRVGVIAVQDEGFDPDSWWETSRAVQVILNEAVGYLYWKLVCLSI